MLINIFAIPCMPFDAAYTQDHSARLKQWVTMGFTLLILGLVLHFTHGVAHHPTVKSVQLLLYLSSFIANNNMRL